MTAITCIYCGAEGVLNMHGLENENSLKVFKRVGRNHVSGHLHYQCPVCKIILLVDPVLVGKSDHIFEHEDADKKFTPLCKFPDTIFPRIPGICYG